MSELKERIWAVMSERGIEAKSLEHGEAARLVRQLASEKVSGLCVITDDAARRLAAAAKGPTNARAATVTTAPNNAAPHNSAARRRRANKVTS